MEIKKRIRIEFEQLRGIYDSVVGNKPVLTASPDVMDMTLLIGRSDSLTAGLCMQMYAAGAASFLRIAKEAFEVSSQYRRLDPDRFANCGERPFSRISKLVQDYVAELRLTPP